jgi:glycolate dehydrogenase FAD-linked subunit
LVKDLEKDIASLLTPGEVVSGQEALICYGGDSTRLTGTADAVVRPETVESIRLVMGYAAKEKIPVTPRGAGTGLSGGCVPVNGGIVVSTERLNRIIEIDPVDLVAVVEPGVITASLHSAVEAHGLFYPPDPGSHAFCTLGGNIAENAGGLRGLKYGVTRDYVMGLDIVLPDGRTFKAGSRTRKNVTGYDMVRLFTGSEGTLGFITGATLKLIPLPETKAGFLAAFDTLEQASEAVVLIIKSGITPSTLEIMDSVTLKAVASYRSGSDNREHSASAPSPFNGGEGTPGALLLIEVDGSGPDVARQSAKLLDALKWSGVKELRQAKDPLEQEEIWTARRSALTALARVSPSVILEDATVPRGEVPAMVRAIRSVAEKYGLVIGTFGHAGDGNLHPTVITDLRIDENRLKVKAAVDEIFAAALKLGGTLSGEHGIGLMKSSYMESELGEAGLSAMRAVKDALDPQGIMNPGKIFV